MHPPLRAPVPKEGFFGDIFQSDLCSSLSGQQLFGLQYRQECVQLHEDASPPFHTPQLITAASPDSIKARPP